MSDTSSAAQPQGDSLPPDGIPQISEETSLHVLEGR
jgi:hypothetical protein